MEKMNEQQLTTKTARELQGLKKYLDTATNKYSEQYQCAKQEFKMVISMKNELKEIIKAKQTSKIMQELIQMRLRINNFIQEIESVQNDIL